MITDEGIKFAVCELSPAYNGDSGLINGLAGAGTHTKIVQHSETAFAFFDTEDEAKTWATENGYDPLLVEKVKLHTITPEL